MSLNKKPVKLILLILICSSAFAEIINFECYFNQPREYDVQGNESYKIYRKPNEDKFVYDTDKKKILSTSYHFSQITSPETQCVMDDKKLYCKLPHPDKDTKHYIDVNIDLVTFKAEAHNTMSSSIHIHLNDGHCHRASYD